jgi:hypothetical protein
MVLYNIELHLIAIMYWNCPNFVGRLMGGGILFTSPKLGPTVAFLFLALSSMMITPTLLLALQN